MLDMQPLHLITICIGFIIAYGLLQAVEFFRRRRRERAEDAEARAAQSTEEPPNPGN